MPIFDARQAVALRRPVLACLVLLALLSRAFPLAASEDGPEPQWVLGDTHVHTNGCGQSLSPVSLLDLLAEQRPGVGAALVWGDGYWNDRPYFSGEDHRISRPGLIVHYDLEVSRFPAAQGGHLVLLGLRSVDFSERPFETPKSGVPIVDWARAQGQRVLLGMAHGQFWPGDGHFPTPEETCCIPFEFPIHVARQRIDFLETERRGGGPAVDNGTFLLWKSLLNVGFRVALTGASDFPCFHTDFNRTTPKTDVLVEGELTYERWLDGIRHGRTVVETGDGNRIELRVNGAPLGSEVRVAAGEVVWVSVETRLGEPAGIEILANGKPVADFRVDRGARVTSIPVSAASSFWIAARSHRAMTGAIYVLVEGEPIRASAEDACYLTRYVDHLIGLVKEGRLPLEESTSVALAAYEEARAVFAKRFVEAGGQSCP